MAGRKSTRSKAKKSASKVRKASRTKVRSKTKSKAKAKSKSKSKVKSTPKSNAKSKAKSKQKRATTASSKQKSSAKRGRPKSATKAKRSSAKREGKDGQLGRKLDKQGAIRVVTRKLKKRAAAKKKLAQGGTKGKSEGKRSVVEESKGTNEEEISRLIGLGKEKGYVTVEDLSQALDSDSVSEDEMEEVISMFGEHDIDVVDFKPDQSDDEMGATSRASRRYAEDAEDYTIGKSTDPVRMYLREMGNVNLLTREGEVAIAKKIEAGQLVAQEQILRLPISLEYILELLNKVKNDEIRMRDLFVEEETEMGPGTEGVMSRGTALREPLLLLSR